MRISIHIDRQTHQSDDSGVTWQTFPRGQFHDPSSVSLNNAGNGIRVVRDTDEVPTRLEVTFNGEEWTTLPWDKLRFRVSAASLIKGMRPGKDTWPPQNISQAYISEDNILCFAWTDPWLFDNPHSHLIYSFSRSEKWNHLEFNSKRITIARSPVKEVVHVFYGKNKTAIATDKVMHDTVDIISSPEDIFLLQVVFADENNGAAYYLDFRDHTYVVGVITTDAGRSWKTTFTIPYLGQADINTPGVVVLDVS